MPAHRINYFLKTPSDAPSWLDEVRQLNKLQQTFSGLVPPPLARACTVGQYARGTMLIYADNGAIAAKLKQLTPRLLLDFWKTGLEVSVIRVEVQVRPSRPEAPPICSRMSPAGLKSLESLASELPESPLREALDRLLKHHRALPKPPK